MSVEERYAAVEAHLAILNIEGEYARTWDTGDADGWAALFGEDGTFRTIGVGKLPSGTFAGRAALVEFCVDTRRYFEGIHLIHTPSVTVDGSRANSWIHFEFQSNRANARTSELNRAAGVYWTEYCQTPDGWRIHHRTERVVTINGRQYHGVPDDLRG